MKKRFVSFMVAFCMIMALATISVSAAEMVEDIEDGFYYIQHYESGRFLEVDPENLEKDEESIRVWDKVYARQSQVFKLTSTSEGWVITCYPSGKNLEILDDSKFDYATIVQNVNEDDDIDSGKWKIVKNSDGTVSIRNMNSAKYMAVAGDYTKNGATLVQYRYNVSRYILYRLDESDVLSAKWTNKLEQSDIVWSSGNKNNNVLNLTEWTHKNKYYYPTPGNTYLTEAEYITPADVARIAAIRKDLPKYWESVRDAVEGKLSEEEVKNLVSGLGFLNTEYLGNGLGILDVLWQTRYEKDWNNFLKAASPDRYGRYSGVMVFKNEIVTERGNYSTGTISTVWTKIIETVNQYSYSTWTEESFGDLSTKGEWTYLFK